MEFTKDELDYIEPLVEKVRKGYGKIEYLPAMLSYQEVLDYFNSFDYIRDYLKDWKLLDTNYLFTVKYEFYHSQQIFIRILKEDKIVMCDVGECFSIGFYGKGSFECKIEDFIENLERIRNLPRTMT